MESPRPRAAPAAAGRSRIADASPGRRIARGITTLMKARPPSRKASPAKERPLAGFQGNGLSHRGSGRAGPEAIGVPRAGGNDPSSRVGSAVRQIVASPLLERRRGGLLGPPGSRTAVEPRPAHRGRPVAPSRPTMASSTTIAGCPDRAGMTCRTHCEVGQDHRSTRSPRVARRRSASTNRSSSRPSPSRSALIRRLDQHGGRLRPALSRPRASRIMILCPRLETATLRQTSRRPLPSKSARQKSPFSL